MSTAYLSHELAPCATTTAERTTVRVPAGGSAFGQATRGGVSEGACGAPADGGGAAAAAPAAAAAAAAAPSAAAAAAATAAAAAAPAAAAAAAAAAPAGMPASRAAAAAAAAAPAGMPASRAATCSNQIEGKQCVPYKYRDVVRKQDERQALPGFSCPQCRYAGLPIAWIDQHNRRRRGLPMWTPQNSTCPSVASTHVTPKRAKNGVRMHGMRSAMPAII
eukprot:357211-Chlamydomonas_euryale.AAC.1